MEYKLERVKGPKCKNEKKKLKMQRPNMALTQKKMDKVNWSLIFERPKM